MSFEKLFKRKVEILDTHPAEQRVNAAEEHHKKNSEGGKVQLIASRTGTARHTELRKGEPINCRICGENDNWEQDGWTQYKDGITEEGFGRVKREWKVWKCSHGGVENAEFLENKSTLPDDV